VAYIIYKQKDSIKLKFFRRKSQKNCSSVVNGTKLDVANCHLFFEQEHLPKCPSLDRKYFA